MQFEGKAIDMESIAPRTEHLQKRPTPLRSANILHRRPARTNNNLEVINKFFCLSSKPRSICVDSQGEVEPLLRRPSGRRIWKRDLTINLSIHLTASIVRLRSWSVVLNDDL